MQAEAVLPVTWEAMARVLVNAERVALLSTIGAVRYILKDAYWRLPHWIMSDEAPREMGAAASSSTGVPTPIIFGIGEHLLSLVPLLEEHTQMSTMSSGVAAERRIDEEVSQQDAKGGAEMGRATTIPERRVSKAATVFEGFNGVLLEGSHLLPNVLFNVELLVCQSVLRIRHLTAAGCRQLATDIEYIGRAVNALGGHSTVAQRTPINPSLAELRAAAVTFDSLLDAIRSKISPVDTLGGGIDVGIGVRTGGRISSDNGRPHPAELSAGAVGRGTESGHGAIDDNEAASEGVFHRFLRDVCE